MLERGVPSNFGAFVLRYWYIYIGVPMRNPREGGHAGQAIRPSGASDQTVRSGGVRETLKPWMPYLGGTPNGMG
jgi:hypothetical protein